MVNVIFPIYAVIFIALLIGSGFIAKKWVSEADDYIIAGREVSMPINMLGVVAIGFAGTSIALGPGFSILYGAKASLAWGLIYAICGLMLYANIFSKFIRTSGCQTLAEYFETRYNGTIRGLIATTSVVGMCGILANNVVSLTSIVAGYTGWPIPAITAVVFLVILIFTTMSGMWATTITDFIQVTIGTIAVPVFLIILVIKFGWTDFFASSWLTGDWWNQGITGLSMPVMSIKYPSAITMVFLFGAALVWGNNYYWIKMASCRNEHVARKSYTYGSLYLIFVFTIPLTIIGVYAGSVMPEAFSLVGGSAPYAGAYGVIARILPPALGSLFIVGAAAAALSTSSTAAMGATATAARDIYKRMINKDASPEQTLKASKMTMALILIITWIMTFFPGGPTYLFAFANAWLVPPAVLLLLGVFWPRFNTRGAFWGALCGMLTMVALTILELTNIFVIGEYTHMAIVGFIVTFAVGIIAALSDKPDYFAAPDWNIKASEGEREEVELNEFDLKVLEMIRLGHQYMVDLNDGLRVDAKITSNSVEKLDKGGYLEREGLKGSKFFTFTATEKANEVLAELNEVEENMLKDYLNPNYIAFLDMTLNTPDRIGIFAKEHDIASLQMSSMVSHLTRRGYITEYGMFRRRVRITDAGRSMVEKYAVSENIA